MTERPILFSAPMVRAIRNGSKTQTRRMVKPQLPFCQPHPGGGWIFTDAKLASEDVARYAIGAHGMLCPYGQPGDRLWVREAWMPADTSSDDDAVWVLYKASNDIRPDGISPEKFGSSLKRPAPANVVEKARQRIEYEESCGERWSPSIHMPRWASRMTLEVLGVRVERVQDISEEDARAEGATLADGQWTDEDGTLRSDYRTAFRRLWISINGQDSWDANPWVWVVEFRRLP